MAVGVSCHDVTTGSVHTCTHMLSTNDLPGLVLELSFPRIYSYVA